MNKATLKKIKSILRDLKYIQDSALAMDLLPRTGTVVKLKKESLEWGAKHSDSAVRPDGTVEDDCIVSYLTEAMFSDDIKAVVDRYGSVDDDATKLFGKQIPFVRVSLFLDDEYFDSKYVSILDIESIYD